MASGLLGLVCSMAVIESVFPVSLTNPEAPQYPEPGRLQRFSLACLVAFWPFIFYYKYIIPGYSFSRLLGNDFIDLYYKYKVYLLDKLIHFEIPLWSPSEAAGYPFYSNPFTQTFYPLNIPLAFVYRLLQGYSYVDHQIFTVSAVSIFALGLYLWI